MAVWSRVMPLAASLPARSSCETGGLHLSRASRIRRPVRFLWADPLVLFTACWFHMPIPAELCARIMWTLHSQKYFKIVLADRFWLRQHCARSIRRALLGMSFLH